MAARTGMEADRTVRDRREEEGRQRGRVVAAAAMRADEGGVTAVQCTRRFLSIYCCLIGALLFICYFLWSGHWRRVVIFVHASGTAGEAES
jgi:hypothetical protein